MIPALVAGGIALANIIGNQMSNSASAAQADNAMNRQLDASNTAHQREVQDLRLAGLNPILSANSSGAPGISGQVGNVENPAKGIADAANTALAVRSQNSALENQEADTDLKHDQASNLASQRSKMVSETQSINYQIENQKLQNRMLKETLPAMIKEAKAKGDWAQVNQIMGIINSGANSANAIMNIAKPMK